VIIAGGIIVPELQNLYEKSFFGIGFGIEGTPIDILPIYHLSQLMPNLNLLVVDEFLKFNGLDDGLVSKLKSRFVNSIIKLSRIFGFTPEILYCSEFMSSQEYVNVFNTIKDKILSCHELLEQVLQTIPENKKSLLSAKEYPMHEFACVKFLSDQGYLLKIGPSKEMEYDKIMKSLGLSINICYILDAYALGTKTADIVVHYIPGSRGPNNGQRIFLEDDKDKVKAKLLLGCDEALRYFCRIASVSGILKGKRHLCDEEIHALYGKKLKREAVSLVLENIVNPYQEAD